MREWILAAFFAVAAALIVIGVHTFSAGAALVVAGLLLGAWAWLVVAE